MTSVKRRPIVKFLEATGSDLSILRELIRRYYEFDGISFDRKAISEGLRSLLANPSAGRAFFVSYQSKPVGYLIFTYAFDLEFGGRVAVMTDLYLKPEYRGIGMGKRALRFVESVCRKEKIPTLELQVERHNLYALSFYKRFGFRSHNRIPMSKHIGRSTSERSH